MILLAGRQAGFRQSCWRECSLAVGRQTGSAAGSLVEDRLAVGLITGVKLERKMVMNDDWSKMFRRNLRNLSLKTMIDHGELCIVHTVQDCVLCNQGCESRRQTFSSITRTTFPEI